MLCYVVTIILFYLRGDDVTEFTASTEHLMHAVADTLLPTVVSSACFCSGDELFTNKWMTKILRAMFKYIDLLY